MKILIVDDIESKRNEIKSHLLDCGVGDAAIHFADCALEAKRQLKRTRYDLLILDIMLPQRANDIASAINALHLLQEVCETDLYLRPIKVIGLTAFDDAIHAIKSEFDSYAWTIIKYEISSNAWKIALKNCVDYIRSRSLVQHDYDVDVCILAALDSPELSAILDLPFGWSEPTPLDDTIFLFNGFNISYIR